MFTLLAQVFAGPSPLSASSSQFPTPPQEYVFLAWLVAALIILLGAAVAVVTIWDKVRSKPPHSQVFATKDELRALHAHVDQEVALTNRNMENVESRAKAEIKHLEERILQQMGENRSNNDHRFGELSGKMDAMGNNIQQLSNDLFRAVGVLEGTTRKAAA